MKKILATVLALMMVLSLVACGASEEKKETVGNTDVAVGNESYAELAKNIKAIYDSAGETSAEQFTKTLMQGMTEAQREAFAAELEKLGL